MQKRTDGSMIFSPTDLTRYFESRFASWMDHYDKLFENTFGPLGKINRNPPDSLLALLKDMGNQHEGSVVEQLGKTHKILKIDGVGQSEKIEKTMKAMKEGADIIYQAALDTTNFFGYSDLLVKKEGASDFGRHYYVPYDVKLATEPNPTAILQLLTYCDMLNEIQGRCPDEIVVITKDGTHHSYLVQNLFYYYLYFKNGFLGFHKYFSPEDQPLPEKTNEHWDWSIYAKRILHERDDVALTAKLRANHLQFLKEEGILTLTQLSEYTDSKIKGIPDDTLATLKAQAKLQVESKNKRPPLFSVLNHTGRMGLAMLPERTDSDIFFDMEGYPLFGNSGLEYLYGFSDRSRDYKTIWAYQPSDEGVAFKSFVDHIHEKWSNHQKMKVYHYGHYEPSTLKRLMGQHGICERKIDDLLRAEVFVDLFQVLKQAMLVGTYNYSLKSIEALYYPERETEISSGAESAVEFSRWLRVGGDPTTSDFLKRIEAYNKDDCLSTLELEDFLRNIKIKNGIIFVPSPSSEGERKEEDPTSLKFQCSEQSRRMIDSLIPTVLGLSFEESEISSFVCEQIAYCLDFVRREDNPEWWDYFSKQDLSQDDLRDDPEALVDVSIVRRSEDGFVCKFDVDQDSKYHTGLKVRVLENLSPHEQISVEKIDYTTGEIILKGKFSKVPTGSFTLAPGKLFFNKDMILSALLNIAQSYNKESRNFGLKKCVYDTLTKSAPDIEGRIEGTPLIKGEDMISEAVNLILKMKDTILCVQGPPGTGKTYTGSHVIDGLVKQGKRIAISSNSHKAMNHLAKRVADLNSSCRILKLSSGDKLKDDKEQFAGTRVEVKTTSAKQTELRGYQVIVGTVYYLSKLENEVDYLFIDEATQVALPNLLALANCTRNIVLLGDQMQLEQPIKGAHPGESGHSALVYLTNGSKTVSPDFGIFLDKTYRMQPEICSFISEEFYEGRLHSVAETSRQKILLSVGKQAGLLFVPVEHDGNSHSSSEEIRSITALVEQFLKSEWINGKGEKRSITLDDILIVAPYNHQVALLKNALPKEARVGTVDLFQGQEAAIVITSMCSSTLEDAPRGARFLLDANRMNVAISRAKALSIVVGSPRLADGQSSSIETMKLISTYCRLVMQHTH